ncbi:hypothetical protein M0765_019680 [Variovorax sp. S2]|uniref:hypothetical protein n=1 Tax=Variovorax sp. S12S4 TaxID=3029170 RepID=UPI00215C173D|nr:hypothetical protein [Variovorax sp. S12S4]MCR8959873.1 hypothetical protein [Variovorax sp. S12S4]
MTNIQIAWEGLANAMRLYTESKFRFQELLKVDREEAINNMDRAFEAKLEKFHALYDVTKKLAGFGYFGHGDTSLVVVLRNALHHRDHSLFVSWNARIGLDDGARRLAGAEFLLASVTPEAQETTTRFYFLLYDFYACLANPRIQNPAALRALWDIELQFARMTQEAAEHGYPESQVYVDVMPAFMAAVRRVCGWLEASGFQPRGFDGDTYFEHFRNLTLPEEFGYKRLRLPA